MNQIREIAIIKNVSVRQLIIKTGISKSYIYDIINGKSIPTITVAQKIARALDSSIERIFPEEAEEG